jgi:hypothetical protein
MDLFKGEADFSGVPCVFDDGHLSDQHLIAIKTFLDPTPADALTYVRWGATKASLEPTATEAMPEMSRLGFLDWL